ncbi:hypothetical protein PILCRDRAFT_821903 [Piloderma croceum F 1598]|uniref:Protein kinase domain-containing protein n=1 Tax=Piloderma croceum (strain F 1598) TaxID=765440 RepID=A0A0C3F8I1_PILCF|nr:hypothetical protein PILCRDRAFT_821903 [Piloderma croceum F 1598]
MPFLGLCGGIATVPAMISPLYGGNIFWYLRNNPQVDHLEILIGIACGLCHLHSKNIIHGDFDGVRSFPASVMLL